MDYMSKTNFALLLFGVAIVVGFLSSRQVETFIQKDAGMPLDAPPMGPYDTANKGWMATEHMPVGSLPQNKSLEQNKLMYLVGNKVGHECCPATFTTDTGCVCLTQEDRNLMARRGGNK
jgi:hypothetical protein